MNLRFKPPISGIIASVGSLFSPKDGGDDNRKALDFDRDGNTLYKEDIIKKVMDDLERRKSERSVLEQQWTLNANFLCGNQFCEINPYRGGI